MEQSLFAKKAEILKIPPFLYNHLNQGANYAKELSRRIFFKDYHISRFFTASSNQ